MNILDPCRLSRMAGCPRCVGSMLHWRCLHELEHTYWNTHIQSEYVYVLKSIYTRVEA